MSVLLALAIVLVQGASIAGFVVQRRRRQQAEQALLRNQARTGAILRMVPDLMFVISADGTYLDYHARDPRDLFTPPEHFIGKRMRDVLPPDLVPGFERLIAEALKGDEPVSLDYSLPMDGGFRHFETRVVRSDHNTVISVVRDVTARHQAHEELHKTQAELAQAARIRSLGELAAGVTHEVSQPLAAMITNARAGLRTLQTGDHDPEMLRDVLQDIVSDGKRASEVIARVRSLVKHAPLQLAPLAINDVIDDVIALSGRMLRDRRVKLRLSPQSDLPLVVGDRVQLQQVLLNLVINAADSMQEMHARARMLEIRSVRRDGHIAITVRDSGPGLSERSVRKIFSPFFTTKPEGMGVGLSISRSIVEAHGGRLTLTGNSHDGATFEFELPIRELAQTAGALPG